MHIPSRLAIKLLLIMHLANHDYRTKPERAKLLLPLAPTLLLSSASTWTRAVCLTRALGAAWLL
jgi:hypothetical protein